MESAKSFLGTGWSFPPTFRLAIGGPEMLTGKEDVDSSIHIILSTITGERVMLPTFGLDLQPHVFDSMNVSTLTLLEKIVREALVFHEPRIIVEQIITTRRQEEGFLEFDIQYTIITTNTRYNYVYPYYVLEATNIDRG